MGFVDTVMVGRLGPKSLAGVALGNTLFYTAILICMGVLMAVSPMVSQAFGSGKKEPVGRSVRQGLWLAVLLTIPSFTFVWSAGPILSFMGQDSDNIQSAVSYLRAISWGILPFLGFTVLRSFSEGVSRPRPVTVIALTGVGINIAANYILMYGKLGFPALGLVGTGWASTVAFWLNFLMLLVFTVSEKSFFEYRIFSKIGRPDPHYLRELFRIGWPIGASMGLEMSLFAIAVMMMGWIGTAQLAAHQVAIQCAAFTFMIPLGIGMASSVRVGQAVGRHDSLGSVRAGLSGIGLSVAFMTLAAILFWTVPRAVVSLYLDLGDSENAAVVDIAVTLLGIAAVFQVFDGIQVSAMGALRGLKDTRTPMILAMVAYWLVGLSAAYFLAFVLDLEEIGLWWGLVIGLGSAAVLLSIRFLRQSSTVY